jgi:glutathione S-transferase
MTSHSLKLRYLSAWFCPYAHRATIALEHHSGRVSYEWVEALGWEQRNDEKNVTGTGKEWWYHWKADELTRCNPSGLVPTLIPLDENGKPNEEKSVYESLITIDYIDAIAKPKTEQQSLVPTDPYLAAKCRYWADKINRECCSPYYGVLVRTDQKERLEHFRKLINGLKAFSREIEKNNSGNSYGKTTFLGGDRILSNTDISLIPWAFRYYIFEHYRGEEYAIPYHDPELHAYRDWFDHVLSLDAVKRTLPDKDQYLEHIGKYADSSARSKVANAVRRGAAAHEIEDDKDTY